ncbi:hypothetical protein [Bradyrhizobium genosp. P]|uniref:hypothetical protein n=1 Tax=Bradyrhizobium genosp. P TaxID=83641 RepID=UPI003CEFEBB6
MDYATFSARFDLGLRVLRIIPKAVIVAMMTAVSVAIFTGGYWKALWIGTFAFLLSMFTTWRRYLEPISFFIFLAALVVTCTEPATLAKIQTALLTLNCGQ